MRPIHLISAFALAACGELPAPLSYETTTTSVVARPHAAHALLADTAACWLGGIWGDVQAETPQERERASQARCDVVVRVVFGSSDRRRYLQLRAFDPETTGEVKGAIGRAASRDPAEAKRGDVLVRMFTALAAAQEETTLARRAAHRITRDLDHEREKLSDDEARALPELEAFNGFAALYRMDAGDLHAEAHALALLVLLDRMRVAEQLPVHLKPYVVVQPLREVFSAPMPTLPYDASKPLDRGGWLLYLTDVANQARHPIPDTSRPPQVRHEAAMAGILEGVADQLRSDSNAIESDTPLAHIVKLTIRALDQSRDRARL